MTILSSQQLAAVKRRPWATTSRACARLARCLQCLWEVYGSQQGANVHGLPKIFDDLQRFPPAALIISVIVVLIVVLLVAVAIAAETIARRIVPVVTARVAIGDANSSEPESSAGTSYNFYCTEKALGTIVEGLTR